MNIQRCFSFARRLLVVTIVCILALSPILPEMTKIAEAQGGVGVAEHLPRAAGIEATGKMPCLARAARDIWATASKRFGAEYRFEAVTFDTLTVMGESVHTLIDETNVG